MSINNFKISITTASILYQEGITIPKISSNNSLVSQKQSNTNHVVIISNLPIMPVHTEWLEKVLTYCNLGWDDTTLLAYDMTQDIAHIQDKFNPKQIWVFGINYNALKINNVKTIHFETLSYQHTLLLALPRIETFFDPQIMKEHKRALLYALKKIFRL